MARDGSNRGTLASPVDYKSVFDESGIPRKSEDIEKSLLTVGECDKWSGQVTPHPASANSYSAISVDSQASFDRPECSASRQAGQWSPPPPTWPPPAQEGFQPQPLANSQPAWAWDIPADPTPGVRAECSSPAMDTTHYLPLCSELLQGNLIRYKPCAVGVLVSVDHACHRVFLHRLYVRNSCLGLMTNARHLAELGFPSVSDSELRSLTLIDLLQRNAHSESLSLRVTLFDESLRLPPTFPFPASVGDQKVQVHCQKPSTPARWDSCPGPKEIQPQYGGKCVSPSPASPSSDSVPYEDVIEVFGFF